MKPYLSVLLNIVFPAAGHYYLGYKKRAIVLGSCLVISFLFGLALDFDFYYRYNDVKKRAFTTHIAQNTVEKAPENSGNEPWFRVNTKNDPVVRFQNLKPESFGDSIILKGHGRPGLAIEVLNENNNQKVQTQADYRGFFILPPLKLEKGDNRLLYGAANDFYTKESDQEIHISDYDAQARYVPGTLETIWHFIYQAIFPTLTTPFLYFSGGFIQGLLINWWEIMPIVKGESTIPAPLRDVGFYFIVLTCMLNLIILFDGFDRSYNKEYIDDIP